MLITGAAPALSEFVQLAIHACECQHEARETEKTVYEPSVVFVLFGVEVVGDKIPQGEHQAKEEGEKEARLGEVAPPVSQVCH